MAFNRIKNWIAHIYLLPFKKFFPRMDLYNDIAKKDNELRENIIFSLFPNTEIEKLELIKRIIAKNEFLSHELVLYYVPEENNKLLHLLMELIDDNEYIYTALVNNYCTKNNVLKEKITHEFLYENKEKWEDIVFSLIKKDLCIQEKINASFAEGIRLTQGRIEKAVYMFDDQILEISGFYLPTSAYDTVEIYLDGEFFGTAEMGIVKQNIWEKYPAYNTINSGWKFEKIIMTEPPEEVSLILKKHGQEIYHDKRKISVSKINGKTINQRFGININSFDFIRPEMQKRIERFNSICSSLNLWMPWTDKNFQIRFSEKKHEIVFGKEPIEKLFIEIFSINNCIYFKNAQIKYQDANKLWIIINELLIQQEYYFETEEEKPFIIDGGANIGLAIYYFKTMYPHAEIIAFEPSTVAFDILNTNVINNYWENVTLLPYALDMTERTCELLVPENDCLGASLTKRALEYETAKIHTEKIETKQLNSYINRKVDFLKLDVEGVEVRILRGLSDKLYFVQHLFCEYHFGTLVTDNDLNELIKILTKYNFQFQLSKSPGYQRATGAQTMKYVGERYSLNIWAKRN